MATEIIIILAITGMVGLLCTPPFIIWLLESIVHTKNKTWTFIKTYSMTHDTHTSTRPTSTPQAPTAGFQTLWVQRQLKKLRERTEALKAQYIKPEDII
jgi:hypothetical protein